MYQPSDNEDYNNLYTHIKTKQRNVSEQLYCLNSILSYIYNQTKRYEDTGIVRGYWNVDKTARVANNGNMYIPVSQKLTGEKVGLNQTAVGSIIKLMIEYGLISKETFVDGIGDVVDYYIPGIKALQYSLSDDLYDNMTFVNSVEESKEKRIEIKRTFRKYKVARTLKRGMDETIEHLRVNIDKINKLKDRVSEGDLHYFYTTHVMNELFECDVNRFSICEYGRIHTPFTNLAKPLRNIIFEGGREFDFVNSQPMIFSHFLIKYLTEKNKTRSESTIEYLELTQNGEIYDYVVGEFTDYLKHNPIPIQHLRDEIIYKLDTEYSSDDTTENGKKLYQFHLKRIIDIDNTTINRKAVKVLFFTVIFTNLKPKVIDSDYTLKVIFGAFMRSRFKQVLVAMDYYNDNVSNLPVAKYRTTVNKINGKIYKKQISGAKLHRALACRCQMMESDIMFNGIIPALQDLIDFEKYFIVTIHDSCIIKAKNHKDELTTKQADTIKETMMRIVKEYTKLDNVEIHNNII